MAMDFRNKVIEHERRLVSYVAENFRLRYDLEDFTHLTQVMQADAISTAYKCWRREWGSRGQTVWWGAGIATQRLLANYFLVCSRLSSRSEAGVLCDQAGYETHNHWIPTQIQELDRAAS
jgi:hypothetical protein